MLDLCPKCTNCYLRHATWTLIGKAEKAARNLTGETDYQVTKTHCESCGHCQYRARPLLTKTRTTL